MIAERCFTCDEQAYVWKSDRGVTERFYEIWTGKESYLKYLGEGLCRDMRSFGILDRKREIRLLKPKEGYSLSLCAGDEEYTFELPDIRQL